MFPKVTDAGIRRLTKCTKLEAVELRGMCYVSNTATEYLRHHIHAQHIEHGKAARSSWCRADRLPSDVVVHILPPEAYWF